MPNHFQKTEKQIEAIDLLADPDFLYYLFYGGSRSGKTFILLYALIMRALKEPESRHSIVRYRFNAIKRSIWLDTLPKVLKTCFPGVKVSFNNSDYYLKFTNDSEIWIGGLDDKERTEKILGNEYATIYFNEISEITYSAYSLALTRLAQKTSLINKAYLDCNPPGKLHWSYLMFFDGINPETREELSNPGNYAVFQMNPLDNLKNLPDNYINLHLKSLPYRKRIRFLKGEFQEDLQGALWKRDMIDKYRVVKHPPLKRIIVGVDPAVTSEETSSNTGIVIAGEGNDGDYYVLDDCSMKGSPLSWAKSVSGAYETYEADRVVGEVNNGGDLVESNLRAVNKHISYKSVRASRGKLIRAEPISALYEQGKVHHVGVFPELEDEMCNFSPELNMPSPDRMDALVWALTELTKNKGKRIGGW